MSSSYLADPDKCCSEKITAATSLSALKIAPNSSTASCGHSNRSRNQYPLLRHRVQMAHDSKKASQEFVSFKTNNYKLHFYEVPTGLKFILLTRKTKDELTPDLKLLYATVYIPYVSRNIFYKIGTEIRCQLFEQELAKFLLDLTISIQK